MWADLKNEKGMAQMQNGAAQAAPFACLCVLNAVFRHRPCDREQARRWRQ